MLSYTEENYLKALLQLTVEKGNKEGAGTNELAVHLNLKPATANDMLKKLKEKKLVEYEKYGKSSLTREGRRLATDVVRKHRLWETFLFEKLAFAWDEVHEVAEQLEHIQSKKLVDKLDEFLGFPGFDPHGDVIPNARGELQMRSTKTLHEEVVNHRCTMVAVKDNAASFLQYVNQVGLRINDTIHVLSRQPYDDLMEIEVNGKKSSISSRFAENIVVSCKDCDIAKPKIKSLNAIK
ncbi:MAG: metal-dependent transcriptional regulator [Chitinophagaceae bacterium]|nr:metal-dependent transcriptional regulator [Chitinophagaceae bacterium]